MIEPVALKKRQNMLPSGYRTVAKLEWRVDELRAGCAEVFPKLR